MGWLLLFPVILIGAAALTSFVFVRLSWLRITSVGVEIRNFPQEPKIVPIALADQFVATETGGYLSFLRPATAALVLRDGSKVPVRVMGERGGAYGVEALNARLAAVRTQN